MLLVHYGQPIEKLCNFSKKNRILQERLFEYLKNNAEICTVFEYY